MELIKKYKVYGLNIASQIDLPELIPLENHEVEMDVYITYGDMPEEIKNDRQEDIYGYYNGNEMWFYVNNVGQYYIKNGNRIYIEPCENCIAYKIRSFLLGRAMGMLLFQRGVVALHGGVIDIDGQGIAICGKSGAGKSTLLSAFRHSGYKFITDEIIATQVDEDGRVLGVPSYPVQKLSKEIISSMGGNVETLQCNYSPDRMRYLVVDKQKFKDERLFLCAMYEIQVADVDEVTIQELSGIEKMNVLRRNGYYMSLSIRVGFPKDYMSMCIRLVKQMRIFTITRPANKLTINEQKELIYRTLKNKCSQKTG